MDFSQCVKRSDKQEFIKNYIQKNGDTLLNSANWYINIKNKNINIQCKCNEKYLTSWEDYRNGLRHCGNPPGITPIIENNLFYLKQCQGEYKTSQLFGIDTGSFDELKLEAKFNLFSPQPVSVKQYCCNKQIKGIRLLEKWNDNTNGTLTLEVSSDNTFMVKCVSQLGRGHCWYVHIFY